jgi:non-specific serine/threonine protein kinase
MDDRASTRQPYVFVSYASADRERVLAVVDVLRSAGVTCWIDQHGIEGGANWGLRITEAIEGCAVFVLMSSAASLSSRNVRQEVAVAWKFGKPYLPLLLDPTPVPNELTYWLETAQWIAVLDHPSQQWLPKVRQALGHLHQSDAVLAPSAPVLARRPTSQSNLPSPPSSLIGRDREVMEVAALLQAERIVTLSGPGGIGKTRIGIAVGHRMAAAYQDGVVFVDLAPLTDPLLVLPTIAARLNVREAAGQPIRDQLAFALHTQRLLLILDNVEQVIDAASELGRLVAQCPTLALLSTSREPLRISGEVEYPVATLPVPDERQVGEINTLRTIATVALFIQRARAAKPGFDLTPENAATIAAICARLDGLPLAIELAAARIRAMSPQMLVERLGDPLRVLTGGARDLPDRQRTMRDTIAWSFDLLTPDEQRLLCRLSVFVGGWTLDAAEAVVNADGTLDRDMLDGLMSLADKSLITQRGQDDGETRYAMLSTIREFARERLGQHSDPDALHRALAEYAVQRLDARDPSVHDVSMYDVVLYADQEYPNLHAAIRWALDHDVHLAARILSALYWFWILRGRLREGFDLTSEALSTYAPRDLLRARLLNTASFTAVSLGDHPTAIRLAEEAVAIARSLAHDGLLAQSLWQAGVAYLTHGDLDRALDRYQEGLLLSRSHGDRFAHMCCLMGVGRVAAYRGDFERAVNLLDEAVALGRSGPEPVVWGATLVVLAYVLVAREEEQRALELYREVIAQPVAFADIRFVVVSIEGVATILAATDPQHATMLMGAARAVRDRIALGLAPRLLNTEQRLADLRQTLDADAFAQAWERGQRLSLDEVKALALGQTND